MLKDVRIKGEGIHFGVGLEFYFGVMNSPLLSEQDKNFILAYMNICMKTTFDRSYRYTYTPIYKYVYLNISMRIFVSR